MICPACQQEVEAGDFSIYRIVDGMLELLFVCPAPECGLNRWVYVGQAQLNRTSDREEVCDGAGDADGADGADNPWSNVAAPGEDEV